MRAKIFGDFTFVNKKVPKLKNKCHFIITTLEVEKAKVVLFLRFGHYLYPKIENRVRKFYYIKTLPDVKTSCTMLQTTIKFKVVVTKSQYFWPRTTSF